MCEDKNELIGGSHGHEFGNHEATSKSRMAFADCQTAWKGLELVHIDEDAFTEPPHPDKEGEEGKSGCEAAVANASIE